MTVADRSALLPYAKEILTKVGCEGWDDDDVQYLVERLQFLQNDTIEACSQIAVGWRATVLGWKLSNKITEHDYKINTACATVLERNIRELKAPMPANEDYDGKGLK
jgi:hypothetical protein